MISRLALFSAIAFFPGLCLPSPASAQTVSEDVVGLTRVCRYGPVADVMSTGTQRTLRVGIGQNCPQTYLIGDDPVGAAPPTARLRGESFVEGRRSCNYEQAGRTWTLSAPAGMACPLAAGMIAGTR